MEVYTYLSSKFEDSHDNISHNDVTKDRLAWNIGIEYFIIMIRGKYNILIKIEFNFYIFIKAIAFFE